MTIPPFDDQGNLPPRIHFCTWDEFLARAEGVDIDYLISNAREHVTASRLGRAIAKPNRLTMVLGFVPQPNLQTTTNYKVY